MGGTQANQGNAPAVVLIVDDAPENLMMLEMVLEDLDASVIQAQSGAEALELAAQHKPALVLLDIIMPGMDGYETCRRLHQQPDLGNTPIIFLSALDDWDQRVKGLEVGAVDYIVKPFHPADVLVRVRNHLELQSLRSELAAQNAELERELAIARELLRAAEERAAGPLVGNSRAVQALRDEIARMGTHLAPVMLFGPPGAGAEGVARAIHRNSTRAERRFIHVDCRTLRDQDEGHLTRPGSDGSPSRLDQASGGTIFLEDLHALSTASLGTVEELLTAIESARSGADAPARVLVSVTPDGHEKLPRTLIDRFAAYMVSIPALKQRLGDLPQLVSHYLNRLSIALGKPLEGVSENTMALLQRHHWSGNLAELESLLHSAAFVSDGPTVVVDQRMLRPQQLGAYELIEKMQSGAMGEVWRARHRLLARPAAVKLIRHEMSTDEKSRQVATTLFRREARATAELTSPYTVRLFDFGVSDEGTFYYVMELLEGLDLRNLVDQFGPLNPSRVAYLASQACGSLSEAHRRGLIHRDIKPSNLFVTHAGAESDVLRVLDFGVVKATVRPVEMDPDAVTDPSFTLLEGTDAMESDVRGTPAYMAPDALIDPDGLDHRADIYSLGCVMFFALTGRPPFEERSATRALMRHVSERPKAPSTVAPDAGIPKEFDALVLKCLAKKAEDRLQSADELRDALDVMARGWTRTHARMWWQDNPLPLRKRSSGDDTFPGHDSEPDRGAVTQTLHALDSSDV